MRKSFLLASSNVRKSRGQMASIFILVLLAALLLNVWLALALDYSRNFDARAEALNAEDDLFVFVSREDAFLSFLEKAIADDENTESYSVENCLSFTGTTNYRGSDMTTYYTVLPLEQALNRQLGQYRVLESAPPKEDGVYLPYLFKTGGGFALGDTVRLSFQSVTYTYTVNGFYENMLGGSFNCGICSLLMGQTAYETLESLHGETIQSVMASVKLKDRANAEKFATRLANRAAQEFPGVQHTQAHYDFCKQARTLTSSICASIVSVLAFFVVLIAFVMISSNVANHISENMKSLGTLKAVGYSSRQLKSALFTQFLVLGLFGAVLGTAFSYAVLPLLYTLLVAQTGIPYAATFLPLPLFITVTAILGCIAAAVALASRRMKKIAPLTALRQEVSTHNFKQNLLPLKKTKLPVNAALSLKTSLRNMKQNAAMFVTTVILSLFAVMSCVMFQNFLIDVDPFLTIVAGERADALITIHENDAATVVAELAADERVAKIYAYTTTSVNHGESALYAYVVDNSADVNNPDVCYAGRLPLFANEVALAGKYAAENGIRQGDEITLNVGDAAASFLVCGFIQCSNYLGKDCFLLSDGYSRLAALHTPSFHVNLTEPSKTRAFLTDVEERYKNSILSTADVKSVIDGSLGIYTNLVAGVVLIVIVITLTIITFVLHLMVKTLLTRKKRDYGILKALGYTTKQLVFQTAFGFLPAILLGILLGFTGGAFCINPLLTLFFSGIGIMKCTFTVPPLLLGLFAAGMALLSFLICCLLSLKIRRITPHSLLTNE